MGLRAWTGDHALQADATTAKNYLGPIELKDLNRLVGMTLDFFEDQTERGHLVSMDDAENALLEILTVNKRKLMPGIGTVTAKRAEDHAKAQYVKFKETRRLAEVRALEAAAGEIKALPKPAKRKRG